MQKFRRAGIDLTDGAATFLNAIGTGRSGNLDFVIKSSPPICVEWKGPDMWQPQDIVKVLLKLLTRQEAATRVFAAILTSRTTGGYGHGEAASKYFHEAVEFVKRLLAFPHLPTQTCMPISSQFQIADQYEFTGDRLTWEPFK